MIKSLLGAALLAAGVGATAIAAELPPPAAGPVTLDERQLDAVAAGNGLGFVGQVFVFTHQPLAPAVRILPEPAIRVVLLLHAPILNN